MTLTIPHRKHESFEDLYSRFKKSLQEMKKGRGWKRIKRETDYEYHYDTLEHHETSNGHHIHIHITFGCNETNLDLKKIKKDLYETWSHYTSRNGFPELSKRHGVDVTPTFLSGHSDGFDTKTIEELTKIYGTHEYWENEYYKTLKEDNYQNPFKKTEEIKEELIMRNRVTKKIKRGKIHRNHNPNQLTHLQTKRNVLIEVEKNPITGIWKPVKVNSIDGLERRTLFEEDLPYPRETCERLAKIMRKNFKDGYYCEMRIESGKPNFKWVPDKHKIYSNEYRSSNQVV